MWILEAEKTGKKHFLLAKKDHLVGRKDTDILIVEDPSISRKHAIFQVSHSEANLGNPEKKPIVLLKDENSKYGTFVNDKQVKVETVLKEGDVITFGQLGNNFKLSYEPLIVTASSLSTANKAELRSTLLRLGGHHLSDWRADCTHLVMNEIKITVKAVCAMVALKPLVLPSYFMDMLERCHTGGNLVDPKDYVPPLGEDSLMQEYVSFNILPERSSLFKNKSFIFFSRKQYKKLHLPISMAGGKAELFDTDEPIGEKKLFHEDSCIVQSDCENSSLQKYMQETKKKLRKIQKRMIPESDIGLAVVYCNLNTYCNPNSRSGFIQPSQLLSQTLSQEVLVPETQPVTDSTFDDCLSSQTSIPETVFFTQRVEDQVSSDDESTLETDETTRKRFRNLSSDELTNHPSSKQRRVEKESIITGSMSIKTEKAADEDRIDWNTADTQPIPTPFSQMISRTSEAQQIKRNVEKKEEISDFENADTQPVSICTSQVLETPEHQLANGGGDSQVVKKLSSPLFGYQPSKTNASLTKNEMEALGVQDDDLPAKLMKVTFQSLVRKPAALNLYEPSTSTSTTKNFKKFKKAQPTSHFHLPRIIGGKDMQVFRQKLGALEVDLWLNEEDDLDMENNIFSNQRQNRKAKRR